jgi:hypothetical protein
VCVCVCVCVCLCVCVCVCVCRMCACVLSKNIIACPRAAYANCTRLYRHASCARMRCRYITDALTPEEALEMLRAKDATKAVRIVALETDGIPAYTTSAGWLGCV